METISDFEDMLMLLHKHDVRYVIIGGMAFIFHAKPRYTKDIDIWIEFSNDNIRRANDALDEFGSSARLSETDASEVLQLGIAPNRFDFFLRVEGMDFSEVWTSRIKAPYGSAPANWIDIDALLQIKSHINSPRHQEDARVLREVIKMKK